MQKSARFVSRLTRALKLAGLSIDGVALTPHEVEGGAARTTYYPLGFTTEAGDRFVRVDWSEEPSLAGIKKANGVFGRLNAPEQFADRRQFQVDEVAAQLRALPDAARQAALLKVAAKVLMMDAGLAEELGVELDGV